MVLLSWSRHAPQRRRAAASVAAGRQPVNLGLTGVVVTSAGAVTEMNTVPTGQLSVPSLAA
jgi:hypothetical protein